jgi:hypothetical protein
VATRQGKQRHRSRSTIEVNLKARVGLGLGAAETGKRYGLDRRFVVGGEYFGPYESKYFAREKHKVRSLANREFFAIRDHP